MADSPENETPAPAEEVDESRREFLRTSVYAAYATPLITTLLVTEKAAAQSVQCPNWLQWACDNVPNPGPRLRDACRRNNC